MAHMQYIPGDPRMVDQLVYELKSRGIFDQFRKDCIADVDTRPAYQNLRQRVENSVATFLSRQCWTPDLNKNQLREKLRKHILDGNYLEQGVERIVDQVVNPKVASVFIPQVEDLVYDFLGITRKKKDVPVAETSNLKANNNDLLPTDLEAVSPGSVKSNDDKTEQMDIDEIKDENKITIDQEHKSCIKEDSSVGLELPEKEKLDGQDTQMSGISELTSNESDVSIDKSSIPLPNDEIKPEDIPRPTDSPPKVAKVELDSIELPKEPYLSTDIPLPDEIHTSDKDHYFKPVNVNSEDESSSDSSLRRNMSPLTPIRNFNNENSCDAQQAFENDSVDKSDEKKEPSTFRFAIAETKSLENSSDGIETEKKDLDQSGLSYQFNNQVNINTFNTPVYDDSSNSNLLHIDYESDVNSKTNTETKAPEADYSQDSKKERKIEEKRSSHKSSHNSRDSHRHSSSKDKRSDSKQSNSRDSSKHDKKSSSSKDDHKSKSSHKESSKDRSDKKDNRDSSKHRSSHKSSSHRDSKSHKSSSSSQRHSSKHSDDKKSSSSSSSHRDKSEKSSEKSSKDSKEKSSKDSSKSSSHRSDKDRKSGSKSKHDDKDKKKEKKETDDHYSSSGRGNHNRRSTDRDSNDGSSSSKGSNNPSSTKSTESKKDNKGTSKSDSTSTSGDSTSPSDKEHCVNETQNTTKEVMQPKLIVRVEHLEMPVATPPRLPFVPDVTLKKPKYAANLEEAKKLMKMRKFLDEEQKRMNQEAALLLEFQANVRPSLSQIYSSIPPGPELEFACVTNPVEMVIEKQQTPESSNSSADTSDDLKTSIQSVETKNDAIIEILTAAQQVENIEEQKQLQIQNNNEILQMVEKVEDEVEADADSKATVKKLETVENIDIADKDTLEREENDNKSDGISVELAMESLHGELYTHNDFKKETESMISKINTIENIQKELNSNKRTEYFEVTIITEELSEAEDSVDSTKDTEIKTSIKKVDEDNEHAEIVTNNVKSKEIEYHTEEHQNKFKIDISNSSSDEKLLRYFREHEKFTAELERDTFSKFLKSYTDNISVSKMYLMNCDTYEENILKEISQHFGKYKIVNYYKNGHFKMSKTTNIVKDLNVSGEIILPNIDYFESNTNRSPIFSPVKSECSFELSSDYDAKLEEMVNKTSRKEIMEIILGNIADESPTKMPKIDYCSELNIESNNENPLKRKFNETESIINNNRPVLTPNKIRKLSGSDQISSTTEENEESSNNNVSTNVRSKYLGRAKRVGLPRPKRTNLPNSPSSDKSIENYEQNTPVSQTPNGKIKETPRNKVQRYDTSDLYKPKLHYLSRRNNIT
ncbi:biorientation of chromosomes in cell division protein 1-like 1 [Galleria mellonella]|uniref:Biorientation of chromosomes in cell division protein 1-like 1 n=1 Tax=Galleria mellonella TaxID=7137 RepID=A0A6J1WI26_GALME|nr:biorientation of chromosomes in cell division protein 1-like 1 [Galleria mellonella]